MTKNEHLDEDVLQQWRKRPWWRRTGPFIPIIVFLGLALPILSYVFMLTNLGWRTPVVGGSLPIAAMSRSGPVYLYASQSVTRYLADVGGDYAVLLDPWRAYFAERGRDYREIGSLNDLGSAPGSVLILPSTITLDEQERARIRSFRAAGGSVLSTWATGSRDGGGNWRGWDFLRDLGIAVTGEIPMDDDHRQLTVVGETPVAGGLSPGQRLWMTQTSEPLLRMQGGMVAARFADWSRVPLPERVDEGAVLLEEGGTSRTAAFAFAESTWAASPVATYQLIDNTLAWLRREPTVTVSNWPQGYRAAYLLEMDTEEGFQNAAVLRDMLLQAQLPGTFFLLTSVAVQHAPLVDSLAAGFETGFHGDIHIGFKDQPAPEQERRMITMRSQLGSTSATAARNAIGFRAPFESYDATTEQLLHKAGIRYHLADPNRSDGQLPLFAQMGGVAETDELLVIPRTQPDDINLLIDAPGSATILSRLTTELNETVRYGGLGVLSLHSQNFAAGSPLATAVQSLIPDLRSRRDANLLWVASGRDIDAWWRERRRVRVSGNVRGGGLEINVSVQGSTPIRGVSFIVTMPNRRMSAEVRSTKVGQKLPKVRHIDDFRSELLFDSLEPGNYAYIVNLSEQRS